MKESLAKNLMRGLGFWCAAVWCSLRRADIWLSIPIRVIERELTKSQILFVFYIPRSKPI